MGVDYAPTIGRIVRAVPKVNVYVPDDLKREMDRYKDQNWSVVAQVAFREKCNSFYKGPVTRRNLGAMDVIWLIRNAIDNYDQQRKKGKK